MTTYPPRNPLLTPEHLHSVTSRQTWLRGETQRINKVFQDRDLAPDVRAELAEHKMAIDLELSRLNRMVKDHNKAANAKPPDPPAQDPARSDQEPATPRTDLGRSLTRGEFLYRRARQLQREVERFRNPAEHLIHFGQALALFLEDQAAFLVKHGEGEKVGLGGQTVIDGGDLLDLERDGLLEPETKIPTLEECAPGPHDLPYGDVWFGEKGFKP